MLQFQLWKKLVVAVVLLGGIVFALPNNIASDPKRIIGGHFLGFFIGSCFAVFPFMGIVFFKAIWFALAIGITILFMVVLDFEHPPAAGTALGMTLVGYSGSAAAAIIISILLLTFIDLYSLILTN